MWLVVWGLAGCGTGEPEAAAPPPAPPSEAIPEPTSRGQVRFTAPEGWTAQEPSSSMRAAQYLVPAAEGAQGETTVVVFWFEGSGGSVEANFRRWAGQFEIEGGGDPVEAATFEEIALDLGKAELMDLSGRFVAETAPGSGDRVDHAGHRMLGAVLQIADGPYFVKMVGPAITVAAQREAFLQLLRTAQ